MNTSNTLLKLLLALSCKSLFNRHFGSSAAPMQTTDDGHWKFIARHEWSARPPIERKRFARPAPFLIIHHSYEPGIALTAEDCRAAMHQIQDFHMNDRHWADIGYSFAICGDGNVYEGRGYEMVGAHAPLYNNRSIGLLLIGDFTAKLPPAPMMAVAQDFINYSIEGGHLRTDFIMHRHMKVKNTECPGDALYAAVKQWPHWEQPK
ncbi:peptidoglycan-recognition protein LB-like [Rhagoletis pomonella]|uniref:peptidoglycan-recognition protein LB-like n=1 Tax=Rhagoletis pomonella TaxID=28610 RepID=UPI001782A410|nr:peptidoglycan-recognition protein LB-like [Rhagoletis pomonella]